MIIYPNHFEIFKISTTNELQKSKTHSRVGFVIYIGAQGRDRTVTKFNLRRILSPVRLPVPPLGRVNLLYQ